MARAIPLLSTADTRMPTEVDGGASGDGHKEFRERDESDNKKLMTLREQCRNKDISMAVPSKAIQGVAVRCQNRTRKTSIVCKFYESKGRGN